MAINFLNTIDFNQNELFHPRIENQPNDASAGTSVDGQLYFNTTNYHLMESDGSGGWKEVGGGVESVGLSMPSAFTVTNSPVTGSGTLTVTGAGTTAQYIRGDGTLATFPTIPTVPSNIVETVTTTDGTYINLTPNTPTDGNVTVTADLSAVDGTSNATTRFLSKDNTWDVPSYTTVTTTDGTYINLTPNSATSGSVTVTADLSAVDGTAGAGERYLTKNNTWATVASIPGTYTFNVTGDTGTPETIGSGNTLDIAGGTNINTAVGATDTVTVNLDDSITLAGTLGVTGTTTLGAVDILGDVDMNSGQINNLGNGTASSDAVNLGQVQSLVAGVGVFQGGYDAINNTPVLTGSSNIALDQGDYFAVTDSNNTSFLGTILEVGDLIFANNDITANSTPTASDYTIVQSGQSIAGSGASDAATIKGIAGFNNSMFVVSSNGWVTVKTADASTNGVGRVTTDPVNNKLGLSASYGLGDGNAKIGLDITGLTEDTSPATDDTIAIYDTSTNTNKKAKLSSIASAIDVSNGVRVDLDGGDTGVTRTESGGITRFDINVSTVEDITSGKAFGASNGLNVKVEVIQASNGATVYAEIIRGGVVSILFSGSVANSTYQALLVDVG